MANTAVHSSLVCMHVYLQKNAQAAATLHSARDFASCEPQSPTPFELDVMHVLGETGGLDGSCLHFLQ